MLQSFARGIKAVRILFTYYTSGSAQNHYFDAACGYAKRYVRHH